MPASFLRRCLAVYLDFGFFWLIWEVAQIGAETGPNILVMLVAFILPRTALRYAVGTPGRALLSISRGNEVDPEIKEGESWLTMLMGILLVKGGLASISAGLVVPVAVPQFGFLPDPSLSAALCAGWGAFNVFAGFLMFKLVRSGLWFGLVSTLLGVVSYFTSLHLMPDFLRAVFAHDGRTSILAPAQREMVIQMLSAGLGLYVAVSGIIIAVGLLFTFPRLTRTG